MNRLGRYLSAAAFWIVAIAISLCGANPLLAEDSVTVAPAWLSHARIAGAELFAEMTDAEIAKSLSGHVAQKVTVVEADSDLSRLLTDKEFEAEIRLMRRYAEAAHKLGIKVVWYFPALEVLSPKAKQGRPSMYKMHPTWVQQGLDGKPNIFYGARKASKARVHWVDPGTESAWMSIHSPYADYFLERIRKIAATGVDGIWLDVPLFNDIGAAWADVSPGSAAKFHADTGLDVPKSANWNDPGWRRWVAWRYEDITNFIVRIRDAAQTVSNDVAIVVETVTLDYDAATQLGLDGSRMKSIPGIIQAWEIDAVSDKTGMRDARPDDWVSLIGMSKFAKAASGGKASWVFTYGKEPDDALLVMAEAIAAGNQPYETKIPLMTTTVGAAYRKRMFSWIQQHDKRLFESMSGAKVAVYYSPESRDYVDKATGSGLYATTRNKDTLWWTNERVNSVYSLTYLGEYRGMIKWLVHNHIPFDIVVRADAGELSRYDTIIAPSLVAISDRDADLLDQYVGAGGNLIVTGPSPASLDEFGNPRPAPALRSLKQTIASVSDLSPSGMDGRRAVHLSKLLGKAYLASDGTAKDGMANARALSEQISAYLPSLLETNAGKDVHVELRKSDTELLVHLVNPERLWNSKAPKRRDVTVSLALPPHTTIVDVKSMSPSMTLAKPSPPISAKKTENPRRAAKSLRSQALSASPPNEAISLVLDQDSQSGKTLPFTLGEGKVTFKVSLEAYAMVVITTKPR